MLDMLPSVWTHTVVSSGPVDTSFLVLHVGLSGLLLLYPSFCHTLLSGCSIRHRHHWHILSHKHSFSSHILSIVACGKCQSLLPVTDRVFLWHRHQSCLPFHDLFQVGAACPCPSCPAWMTHLGSSLLSWVHCRHPCSWPEYVLVCLLEPLSVPAPELMSHAWGLPSPVLVHDYFWLGGWTICVPVSVLGNGRGDPGVFKLGPLPLPFKTPTLAKGWGVYPSLPWG